MRATGRRRARRRRFFVEPGIDLNEVADRVVYVGSPEHKDVPGFAGQPRPRADASICPRDVSDRETVSEWLRSAIRAGATGAPWERGFPRYVWYKDGDTVYEGRLVNRERGLVQGLSARPYGVAARYRGTRCRTLNSQWTGRILTR